MTIYCLVPVNAAEELIVALLGHYESRSEISVIEERRREERRMGLTRNSMSQSALGGLPDRRSLRQSRRPVLPRELGDDLPIELAAHAGSLRWVQRLATLRRGLEYVELGELLNLIARGNALAPSELYWRYVARVNTRAAVLVGDADQAEEVTRRAFGLLFDQLASSDFAEHRSLEHLLDAAVDCAVANVRAREARTGRNVARGSIEPRDGR